MKYYNFDEVQKTAKQNKGFVMGEREAGRKHFERKFELNVKGRGKSKKEKLALAEIKLSLAPKDEEVLIVDPESLKEQP